MGGRGGVVAGRRAAPSQAARRARVGLLRACGLTHVGHLKTTRKKLQPLHR